MDQASKGGAGAFFRKTIRKDSQTVSLDADMIRVLLAVEETKSARQLAAELEMDGPTLKRNIARLIDQGLVEPVDRRHPVLDRSFLQAVRINLSRVIGPMAEILLEDRVAEMNIDPASIPLDIAAELVTRLALEIPGEPGRIQFKKSMIPILNKVKA
jgi:DNA-binding transcriptional MocR family regulator